MSVRALTWKPHAERWDEGIRKSTLLGIGQLKLARWKGHSNGGGAGEIRNGQSKPFLLAQAQVLSKCWMLFA